MDELLHEDWGHPDKLISLPKRLSLLYPLEEGFTKKWGVPAIDAAISCVNKCLNCPLDNAQGLKDPTNKKLEILLKSTFSMTGAVVHPTVAAVGMCQFLKESTTNFTNTTQVTSLVQDCIPTVFLRENSNTGLVYEIPGKVDAMMYQNLFLKLDKNLHALHISGYGITNTTMEQVFLQLLQDGERTLTQHTVLDVDMADYKSNNSNENNHCNYTVKSKKTMQKIQLYLLQISASLIYNFHHTRRDWKGSLANLVLPILFVTMAMGMFNLKPFSFDHPPLKLSSDLYSNEQALFFSTDSSHSNSFPEVIARHFGSQNSTCTYTRCVK
ncbi:glucosylceramide transporter ABCA12-like [Lithobates pipiens]